MDPSARRVRNEGTGRAMMTQNGSRDGNSLGRAFAWAGVLIALCGLVSACVSDPCPGDQVMVREDCTPAAVATEDALVKQHFRATQVAEDERGVAREPAQDDRSGSPLAPPSPASDDAGS